MSIRQYIGARYVPIFFDNNGSSEWVANHAYEPLTIVTYLGNSYTSKKLVTPDVGNPASNSEYWASTGIYNSQVEQYREEVAALAEDVGDLSDDVDDIGSRLTTAEGALQSQGARLGTAEVHIGQLENTVDRLTNRKIIFIGDSYGTGSGGGYTVTPWTVLAGQYLGLTQNTSFWNYSRGGASFSANNGSESDPASGNNYCDLLRKASNELSASVASSITDIVVGGSINDWSGNETKILTGMANFKTLAKSLFPNAKLTFCNVAGSVVFEYKYKYYHDSIRIINQGCGLNGYKLKRCDIDLIQNLSMFNADGVHPTQEGQYAIARRVAVAVNDGDPNFTLVPKAIDGVVFDGIITCDGINYLIKFNQTQKSFADTTTIDSTFRKIDEFDATAFTGYDDALTGISKTNYAVPCAIRTADGWTSGVTMVIAFRQNANDATKCEIWARQVGHFTGNNFTSFAATAIIPYATSIMIPIWAV